MAPSADRRIPSLDGLRAVSIAFVLFHHLAGTRGFPFATLPYWAGDIGNMGVRVFFVISGYLITRLLLTERARTGAISLRAFYLRRTFRIFPAFLVFVGAVALAAAFGLVETAPHDFAYALTYTNDFRVPRPHVSPLNHMWSLSVEEQFYLLWPALLVFLGNRRALIGAATVLVTAPLCRYGIYRLWPAGDPWIAFAFPCVADSIATGCLLAGLEPWLDNPRWKRFATSPWFYVLPIVAWPANMLGEHPLVNLLVAKGFMNIVIALVIHRFVRWPTGIVAAVLNARPLVWLGTLSYSLYLWQCPLLNSHSDATWCSFPANIALALAAAYVSYHLVEQPMLRARVRWFGAAHQAAAPAEPQASLSSGT